jgi:hypothetical protein
LAVTLPSAGGIVAIGSLVATYPAGAIWPIE